MNFLRLSISPLPIPADWYALPLRLIIGFGFVQHGFAKLERGPEAFIGVLHAMGLPAPIFLGWSTIMVELVTKADLNEALERWSLKLSVRLGFMLAAGIAALGAIVKLS